MRSTPVLRTHTSLCRVIATVSPAGPARPPRCFARSSCDSRRMTPITEVEGHRVALSNLEKVLHPATGFTKGELLHYYATTADALLPHLRDRPVSFLRYPDGPDGQVF